MASEHSVPIGPTGPDSGTEPADAPRHLAPSFGAGLTRPSCHWLSERMGAAAGLPPSSLPIVVRAPDTDAPDDRPDEGAAAIATLVALAAEIEAARATPDEPAVVAPTPVTAVAEAAPQFSYDALAAAITAARQPSLEASVAEEDPPIPDVSRNPENAWRWSDALRFHPEAGLVLTAIALVGAWAYLSAPRPPETLPGPVVAEIRPEEAEPRPAPAPEDTRLRFLTRENCEGGSCAPLLDLTPAPVPPTVDQAASVAPYTTAAQSDAEPNETQPGPTPPSEEPSAAQVQGATAPPVAAVAADTAAVPEEIRAEPVVPQPIATEPIATEPVLAAQEPATDKLESPADLSVTMPSALEVSPGNVSEAPAESAAIVPEISPAQALGVEPRAPNDAPATGRQGLGAAPSTARPAKAATAKQPAQAAKKSAGAALPKAVPAKTASTKSKAKSPPAAKQAAAPSVAANKPPGFPAAPQSALIKPAKPVAPQAAASKPPEAASAPPTASFAPGDKAPGFEIQTNLGGGFFTFQPN